jgi:hypothetical protein
MTYRPETPHEINGVQEGNNYYFNWNNYYLNNFPET